MASSKPRTRPVRTLVVLGVMIVALFASVFAGTQFDAKSDDNPGGASWAPQLALDLQGGTQLILAPVTSDGQEVTDEDINQSIAVIRQRIDSSGVAEAEIARQGDKNIVVGIPGEVSQETIDLIVTPAQMTFRPVLQVGSPLPVTDPEATDAPTDAADATLGEPATDETVDESTDDAAADDPASEDSAADSTEAATEPAPEPTDPSDLAQITPAVQEEFDALDCTNPENLVGGIASDPNTPFVTCDQDGLAKYILGPVEVEGSDIDHASSGLRTNSQGIQTNEWAVNLDFTNEGADTFQSVSERLVTLPSPQNQFGIVLDGLVISAPSMNAVITNGQAEISGNFTRESSATLSSQLNFGALPLTFDVQSQEQISATLGADQLQKGLIAGIIGLILVAIYSVFQYRALGLLTLGSLIIAGLVTYGVITLLSWTYGYRLSLPGVAGLIVAIGITADSFIVYFERVRDEIRDGRGLTAAVDRGWDRARRTIIASDVVNFLAAAILYLLAVGGVQGFAFTLGLTTLVDLIIVFFFTHPMMQLLARTKFFGEGHPASGMDPRRLGVESIRYAGRGTVRRKAASTAADESIESTDGATAPGERASVSRRAPVTVGAGSGADDGMTIAERRAARRRAAADETTTDGEPTREQDEEKN